jgi:hypothetical protein
MGRVVYSWFRNISPSSYGKNPPLAQVRTLQHQIAGLPEKASHNDLRNRQEEVLTQVAGVMQVDRNFLERGIVRKAVDTLTGSTLLPLDAANLGIALGVAPFREYLGLRVLGELTHKQ